MPRQIFGRDLGNEAYQIARMSNAGYVMTFIKVMQGVINMASPSQGAPLQETPYPCFGVITTTLDRFQGTLVENVSAVANVFRASLPAGIVPAVNDRLTDRTTTYTVAAVSTDEAEAVYRLQLV